MRRISSVDVRLYRKKWWFSQKQIGSEWFTRWGEEELSGSTRTEFRNSFWEKGCCQCLFSFNEFFLWYVVVPKWCCWIFLFWWKASTILNSQWNVYSLLFENIFLWTMIFSLIILIFYIWRKTHKMVKWSDLHPWFYYREPTFPLSV